MFAITGHLQAYPWGRDGGLNPWLAQPVAGPAAELWFGSHPNGPSPLRDAPGVLADVVEPDAVPLLVKLLAAARPLSIQLHPSAAIAEAMFAAGSPLVADDGEKVELLVALEPFAVFAGWRDQQAAARLLRATSGALDAAAAAVLADDIEATVRLLLGTSPEEVVELTPRLLAAAQEVGLDGEHVHSLALAAESFPGDAGLLVLTLMDHSLLAPGTAVYMPAGGVHSYAQGFGLEVMTSSDNVLRLGLTGKPLAVDEALGALDPHGDPHFIGADVQMEHGHPTVTSYRPYNAPFAVESIHHTSLRASTGEYRLVLSVRGTTEVTCGDQTLLLAPGEAAAVLAGEPGIEVVAADTAIIVEARRRA